jgi:tyrosine-protein phosphatase SIW14
MNHRLTLRLIALLALAAVVFVLTLRIYNAPEDAANARYAEAGSTFAKRRTLPGIPNAGKVSDFLYRGSQPQAAGYQELRRLGVSIVVDLRSTAAAQAAEGRAVASLGLQHVAIPSSGFFGPSDDQVATFLKLVRDNPRKKVFVHCYFGDDRTGVMVAAYRIAEQHWTADQAYNEMRFFHFHNRLIFMGHYVKYFPANFSLSPAFAAFRDPRPPA